MKYKLKKKKKTIKNYKKRSGKNDFLKRDFRILYEKGKRMEKF